MTVEIHWVPRNLGVKGNEIDVKGNKKADETAKEAIERAVMRKCPKRFESLANFRRTISQRK